MAGVRRCSVQGPSPVLPVREVGAGEEFAEDEVICSPCEGEEQIDAVDEEEQARVPQSLPSVYQPTRSEFLGHCVTHYPFRAWCRHCLEGRGREFGHDSSRGEKDARATPVISFDYCFISDVGEVRSQSDFEAAGEGAAKVLVIRDSKSKAVFAHVVPVKGVDEKGFAVDPLTDDVRWLGYNIR